MATPKSQIKAARAWEARNPNRAGYIKLKNAAFAFVDPKPGTKAEEHLAANHEEHLNDLQELKALIEKKLEK